MLIANGNSFSILKVTFPHTLIITIKKRFTDAYNAHAQPTIIKEDETTG